MNSPLRIVFAGTPDFAVPTLQRLIDSPYKPVAVYTQPDRKAGRGQQLRASPVKTVALQADIPVKQVDNFKSAEDRAELDDLKPDFIIVIAYGLLLPQAVLDMARIDCINIHASLLPRWRGAAPIHRALLAGDKQTGVAIMQMVKALDAGPVYAEAATDISAHDTTGSLHDRLAQLGADLLLETLPRIADEQLPAAEQDTQALTYADKLTKAEANINWQLPATTIERQIRGYQPWPVAFTTLNEQRIRIWQSVVVEKSLDNQAAPGTILDVTDAGLLVQTGDGTLQITHLQLPGNKMLAVKDILNANSQRFTPGDCFK